jgi:hypothetical protein
VISGLYEKAGNFGLSREDCTAILSQIAVKYLPPGASRQETAELYGSLRVEELALARCAAGHERAREIFIMRYREKLTTSLAIAKEPAAREPRPPLRRPLRNYCSRRPASSGWPRTWAERFTRGLAADRWRRVRKNRRRQRRPCKP